MVVAAVPLTVVAHFHIYIIISRFVSLQPQAPLLPPLPLRRSISLYTHACVRSCISFIAATVFYTCFHARPCGDGQWRRRRTTEIPVTIIITNIISSWNDVLTELLYWRRCLGFIQTISLNILSLFSALLQSGFTFIVYQWQRWADYFKTFLRFSISLLCFLEKIKFTQVTLKNVICIKFLVFVRYISINFFSILISIITVIVSYSK